MPYCRNKVGLFNKKVERERKTIGVIENNKLQNYHYFRKKGKGVQRFSTSLLSVYLFPLKLRCVIATYKQNRDLKTINLPYLLMQV